MIRRKNDSLVINLAFSAFFCAILGWVLFETILFQHRAEIRFHLMATLIGGIISILALRRCRIWWPGFGSFNPGTQVSSSGYDASDIFPCLALAAIAGLWGLSIKSGLCSVFAVCAAGFIYFPWSKIGFCLRHFFISNAVMAVGAGTVLMSGGALAPGGTLMDLFPYIFDAWALWLIAVLLTLATYRNPGATRAEGPGKVRLQSSEDAIAPN